MSLVNIRTRAQNDLQLRLQREAGGLEQRKLQAGMEEKRLLDRLWDTYGMTHQGALAVRVPVEDAAQAQRRTVQLNQAIQALGTVNLGAVEEFQRVEERYGYLKDQKNDVETAQRELEGVIQEITQEYNITTIINTHDMNSVMEIGEKIVYIHEGRKWWEGTKDDILHADNPELNDFVFASAMAKKAKLAAK